MTRTGEVLTLYEEMHRRMAGLPGVIGVALGSTVPLWTSDFMLEVAVDGQVPRPGEPTPRAEYRTASPEYFEVAGIPLLRGRAFASTDRGEAERVVGQVLRMVLGEGGVLVAWGLGVGLAGSLVAGRLLAGLLFGVPAHDPLMLVGVVALMSAVGLGACAVPALRAARVDPARAIHEH
jgi:hypothetical protein